MAQKQAFLANTKVLRQTVVIQTKINAKYQNFNLEVKVDYSISLAGATSQLQAGL